MAAIEVMEQDRIELTRLKLQARLDASKTQTERNRLGQYATPSELAMQIMNKAKELLPAGKTIRFLDPAIGTGAFYSALLRTFPIHQLESAIGYEIDPHYAHDAKRIWSKTPLDIRVTDFTRAVPDTAKANLVICNPPYVRHHHLSKENKSYLQRTVSEMTGITMSGLAGLYCYFLCLTHIWMEEGAVAGWLIPSEFMDVNYGRKVKEYLLKNVTLLQIHRFDPNDVQFGDAYVSSAVVWFKKSAPSENHPVLFTYGGPLTKPYITKHIQLEILRREAKWTRLPVTTESKRNSRLKLSDLFTIKRGLATGSNDYFIMSAEEAANRSIPEQFLQPILPSPRYLSVDEVKANSQGIPLIDRPLFILSCDMSEAEIRNSHPALWEYLQIGIHKGVSKRYLCQHRSPWYTQEDRPAAPILCTYMGRSDSANDSPFRFILNHSKATAANAYLMLYPNSLLLRSIAGRQEQLRALWLALRQIKPGDLIGEGRVYGGGLYKVEPKELSNTPADSILTALPELLHAQQPALPF